jgi:hypothetical protein
MLVVAHPLDELVTSTASKKKAQLRTAKSRKKWVEKTVIP